MLLVARESTWWGQGKAVNAEAQRGTNEDLHDTIGHDIHYRYNA